MTTQLLEQLRASFNRDGGAVRIIAFLSPTCGPCRYGQGVVRALFDEFPDKRLAGYIVWVPMLPEDSADSAAAEQHAISDPRLTFWYDSDKAAANDWSALLGLPSTAWDVYAIYGGAARWLEEEPPPTPQIWMHQLDPTPATRPEDRLDPKRLAREWLALVVGNTDGAAALSAVLHESGKATRARSPG